VVFLMLVEANRQLRADGVQGPELMESMRAQAERFGAQIVYDDATRLDLDGVGRLPGDVGLELVGHDFVSDGLRTVCHAGLPRGQGCKDARSA